MRWFLIFAASSALLLVSVLFYSFAIEPKCLEVVEVKINSENAAETRIALISDIHVKSEEDRAYLEDVVQQINNLNPDIVILAGDFIDNSESEIAFLSPLKNLSAKNKFAVLGNHDYGIYRYNPHLRNDDLANKTAQALEGMEIVVLRNRAANLNERNISIVGLDDFWAGRMDFEKASEGLDASNYKITVVHEPVAAENWDIDLVLSGHTHGGQVIIPFYGPALNLLGWNIESGMKETCHSQYITRGIGTTGLPVRFSCRPEITLILLDSGSSSK